MSIKEKKIPITSANQRGFKLKIPKINIKIVSKLSFIPFQNRLYGN